MVGIHMISAMNRSQFVVFCSELSYMDYGCQSVNSSVVRAPDM